VVLDGTGSLIAGGIFSGASVTLPIAGTSTTLRRMESTSGWYDALIAKLGPLGAPGWF
jgi:hypothetical protein